MDFLEDAEKQYVVLAKPSWVNKWMPDVVDDKTFVAGDESLWHILYKNCCCMI